jgi:hypothetical protein
MNYAIFLIAFTLLFVALLFTRIEGFGATSPGTMTQLATSHVPTEEDEYYYKHVYPKIIKRDLIEMTGYW